jgi:hypothetical protein
LLKKRNIRPGTRNSGRASAISVVYGSHSRKYYGK